MNDATSANGSRLPIDFKATGGEYFRIWIVNLLLTIVTLGIYSAWAKVRRLRYFYGNTYLAGHSFEYHGQPLAILKGRLIAFGIYLVFVIATQIWPLAGLLALPLVIVIVPWIIMKSRRFQMRMSSWRNLRFNFHGTYGNAFMAYVVWGALAVVSLLILMPVWLQRRVKYVLGEAAYGTQRFSYQGTIGDFYGFFLATLGFGVLLLLVLGLAASLVGVGIGQIGALEQDPAALNSSILLIGFIYIVGILGITGYYQASLNNVALGKLEAGSVRLHASMQAWPYAWILLTNFIGIVCTLGLFYPWAKVRQMRYQLDHLRVEAPAGLDHFVGEAAAAQDAIGEEIGDFFDFDFGF